MFKPSRAKSLSDLLPAALGPAAARQGFAGAEIMSRWEIIVGREIAALATPLKLAAPPRAVADPDAPPPLSTLTLSVAGAFALEIQHRVPEIVERVNGHLGWRCVGAVKLKQGGQTFSRQKPERRAPPPPTDEEVWKVDSATADVEEEELADALRRLGHAAVASARSKRR